MDLGKLFSKVVKAVKDNIETASRPTPQDSQPRQSSSYSNPTPEPEREKTPMEWEAYFGEILATEFPQYGVMRHVPVTNIAGYANDTFQLYKTRQSQAYKAEWGEPYTFVLQQGGVFKGVVMLGSGHSHDSNVKYLISRMYAKKMGIPYINFYTQMPNEKDYVVSRIRRFLN